MPHGDLEYRQDAVFAFFEKLREGDDRLVGERMVRGEAGVLSVVKASSGGEREG